MRLISVTTNIIKSKSQTYTLLTIVSAYLPDQQKSDHQFKMVYDAISEMSGVTSQNSLVMELTPMQQWEK
jgi:hypothetical protein